MVGASGEVLVGMLCKPLYFDYTLRRIEEKFGK